jgi:hypothetical protein
LDVTLWSLVKEIIVLEESAALQIHHKNGDGMFMQNNGTFVPNHTVQCPRRQ